MKAICNYFVIVGLGAAVAFSPTVSEAKSNLPSVLSTYADIAQAGYSDSLAKAKDLKTATETFLKTPNNETLSEARAAWIASRVPYMQTEVFRFGNSIVDDWEGKVNSWPLDEGLIDYVDQGLYGEGSPENELYAANVIANESLNFGGKVVDAKNITKQLLASALHEAGSIEANVATGYHAIEFLLWGQDLNGTKSGAGNRPATDFNISKCTGGNCERRAAYLTVATALLIDDLDWMAKQWAKDGAARQALTQAKGTDSLHRVFQGLGSLAYGQLAGERMKLGLLLHDPEEEQDCFSDNTHNSHFYDVVGIRNIYLGRYKRVDGSELSGPSVSELVRNTAPEINDRVLSQLEKTVAAFEKIVQRAQGKERYDQMIGQGNSEGNAVVQSGIDELIALARELERAAGALQLDSLKFEGSDSLDAPNKVDAPAPQ